MSAWLPIESAPKDGTGILLYSPRDGIASGVWFVQRYKRWREANETTQVLDGYDDYSNWKAMSLTGCDLHRPTHWMPLPDPPEQA